MPGGLRGARSLDCSRGFAHPVRTRRRRTRVRYSGHTRRQRFRGVRRRPGRAPARSARVVRAASFAEFATAAFSSRLHPSRRPRLPGRRHWRRDRRRAPRPSVFPCRRGRPARASPRRQGSRDNTRIHGTDSTDILQGPFPERRRGVGRQGRKPQFGARRLREISALAGGLRFHAGSRSNRTSTSPSPRRSANRQQRRLGIEFSIGPCRLAGQHVKAQQPFPTGNQPDRPLVPFPSAAEYAGYAVAYNTLSDHASERRQSDAPDLASMPSITIDARF